MPKIPSLAVGDRVQARRTNGNWQDATLVEERSGNKFMVNRDNRDRSDRIKHVRDMRKVRFQVTCDDEGRRGVLAGTWDASFCIDGVRKAAARAGIGHEHIGWLITHINGQQVDRANGAAMLATVSVPSNTFEVMLREPVSNTFEIGDLIVGKDGSPATLVQIRNDGTLLVDRFMDDGRFVFPCIHAVRKYLAFQVTRNSDAEAGFKYCPLSSCISEVQTEGAAALAGMDAGHVGCCITHVDGRQLVSKFMVSSVLCGSTEEGLHD